MRKWVKAGLAGLAMTGALAATPAWSQFSKMVVFSDSMSDTYRYFQWNEVLFGTGYPQPPAYEGRFCDGLVAVEFLAQGLNVPIENYSFAGALTGYTTLLPGVMLGVLTQVNEHLNKKALLPTLTTVPILSTFTSWLPFTGRADPKALYVIWAGPDDFYNLGGFNSTTAYTATLNIQQAVTSLYNAGARYFFIPTMPDLSITPRARQRDQSSPGYIADAKKYSEQFETVLNNGIKNLQSRYPKAKIMTFDTNKLLREETAKAIAEGKNVTEACHPGGLNLTQFEENRPVCPDPYNYLFWDDNHPTEYANGILGRAWVDAIVHKP